MCDRTFSAVGPRMGLLASVWSTLAVVNDSEYENCLSLKSF
jgi:hypothetical protein